MKVQLSACRVKRLWAEAPLHSVSHQLRSVLTDFDVTIQRVRQTGGCYCVVSPPRYIVLMTKDKKLLQINKTVKTEYFASKVESCF